MRKCRYCKAELPKKKDCTDGAQRAGFCSLDHMVEHGKAKAMEQKARAWRKEKVARKEKLKTKSDHAREAQQAFNAWVRERDADQPCISCGRHHQGQYHAGHYRSVGSAPELRFNVFNVNKQCVPCNVYLSSNAIDYRIGLIDKYGHEIVEAIEGHHGPKRYTADQLRRIKRIFKRRQKHQRKINERKAQSQCWR